MFAPSNFIEVMQSLMSVTIIVGISAGMSVLISQVLVRSLRDEPTAPVLAFPTAMHHDAPARLKKAA
ncbi:MAG: hypothetical protein U0172_07675 [Nitrospiraceae bacterium]